MIKFISKEEEIEKLKNTLMEKSLETDFVITKNHLSKDEIETLK